MPEPVFCAVGLFDGPAELLAAAGRVRAAGLGSLEAYTPYPVAGLDEALGSRRSPLAGIVLVMGAIGAVAAFAFQFWMNGVDYPLVVGGKDPRSWQAFVPIMFEVTVLFAGCSAALGMLLLGRLPSFRHPVLGSGAAAAVTRDKFGLAIEARGGELDAAAAAAALREAGAGSVELIALPPPPGAAPARLVAGLAAAGALSCVMAGLAAYWAVKLFPVLPPMSRMLEQPRLEAQAASRFFADGRGMRPPVPGTVARGRMPYSYASAEEASTLANPLPRTPKTLALGRGVFNRRCAVCHGALADGAGSLTEEYGAKPADLQARRFLDAPDGLIYHAIMRGKNAMPAQAAFLTEAERWAAVHYVRALQRARHAKDGDLP